MVKVINTLIEKKENCGHNVLKECAKLLKVELPIFSTAVKTADLYLLNQKFRKIFDEIYNLAIQYRESQDLKEEKLDRESYIREIKQNSEVITRHSREFDKRYRESATLEDSSQIKESVERLDVIKLAIKKTEKELKEKTSAYRVQLMKEYGLI